jgi:tRNA(Arg) A34 adenosine deaminase TadA
MWREPSDEQFLARAVGLALDNAAGGQLPFGALVVREGAVPCGWRSDLVSSCEPCAMRHAAALVAGVARIIYAAPKESMPDLGVPFPPIVAQMQTVWRRTGSDPSGATRSVLSASWTTSRGNATTGAARPEWPGDLRPRGVASSRGVIRVAGCR